MNSSYKQDIVLDTGGFILPIFLLKEFKFKIIDYIPLYVDHMGSSASMRRLKTSLIVICNGKNIPSLGPQYFKEYDKRYKFYSDLARSILKQGFIKL